MKKILLLITALFAFLTALTAQITQEEADRVVWERMGQETLPYTIYAKEGIQTEMTITTSTEEVLELDYSCWVYYVNYTGETNNNGRYLIVNESNGNLLEVNTKNDVGPSDLAAWREVVAGTAITPILMVKGYLFEGIGGIFGNSQNFQIITTETEWEGLKNKMSWWANNKETYNSGTEIDFNAYQIIAVFDIQHGIDGWTIDITDITEYSDSIVVTIRNIEKGSDAPMVVQPYHIVKIPISDKRIVFQVIPNEIIALDLGRYTLVHPVPLFEGLPEELYPQIEFLDGENLLLKEGGILREYEYGITNNSIKLLHQDYYPWGRFYYFYARNSTKFEIGCIYDIILGINPTIIMIFEKER